MKLRAAIMTLKANSIAILTCLFVPGVQATTIDVYQGAIPTFKGTIEAYSGSASAVDNYDYFSHSGDPIEGPNTRFYRGEIFFYDGPEGTTFNAIFNKEKERPSDPDIRGAVSWDLISVSSGDPSVLLSDDRNELRESDPDYFKGRWEWHNNTDGGIIQGLDLPFWILAIDPREYDNLDSLKVFSADGERINMNLRTGNRGYMFFVLHPDSVPDTGSTAGLVFFGIAGLAIASRRNQ
jgi:hypothetical protein